MKPGLPLINFKFLCASLLLMLACSAVMAQSDRASASVTKSNSPAGNVCDSDKTFTFSAGSTLFSFCLSDEGTIGALTSPAGFPHISNYEGYVACGTGAMNAYSVGGHLLAESGWGPATTSQPGGPNTLPVTITRNSTDGKFQLKQTFTWDTAQKEITITMVLKNISAASLTNVKLARYFDGDLSSALNSTDQSDDIYNRDTDSVWGKDNGAGAGHHGLALTALSFAVSRSTAVEEFFNFQSTLQTCTPAAASVPTAPGDFTGRLTYNLSTLAAGASRTVKVIYRRF